MIVWTLESFEFDSVGIGLRDRFNDAYNYM